MGDLFGTDGVRGVANKTLTPSLVFKLGQAVADLDVKKAVIGRDTRRSGGMLANSLASGMASVGLDVIHLGVLPTPAVPLLANREGAQLSAVVSASHNLAQDNGIKFFNESGFKLSQQAEHQIEEQLQASTEHKLSQGQDIGHVEYRTSVIQEYQNYLLEHVVPADLSLDGWKIVLDCAHGATYHVAPATLQQLEADTIAINVNPTGDNINQDSGSTCIHELQSAVQSSDAELGIAYDGDGDRALLVDAQGREVDGDSLIYLAASWLQEKGELNPSTVVSTVMSNLGLERALNQRDIILERTRVGDRHVAAKMRETGAVIGGEQSGHIIFGNHHTTGDGLLTTLKIIQFLQESNRNISDWIDEIPTTPQVLNNIPTENKGLLYSNDKIQQAIQYWKEKLNGKGRILVRPSGTQEVVRVMVEATRQEMAEQAANKLASTIDQELN